MLKLPNISFAANLAIIEGSSTRIKTELSAGVMDMLPLLMLGFVSFLGCIFPMKRVISKDDLAITGNT